MHFYDTSTSSLYPLSLHDALPILGGGVRRPGDHAVGLAQLDHHGAEVGDVLDLLARLLEGQDRKSTRLNSSHVAISYAVFCLKTKKEDKVEENRIETKNTTSDMYQ